MPTELKVECHWLVPLALMTGFAFAAAHFLGSVHGIAAAEIVSAYTGRILILSPVAVTASVVGFVLICGLQRERAPLTRLVRLLKNRFPSASVGITGLLGALLLPVLMGAFGTFKMLMPLSRDFDWDSTLAAADRLLFLGWQPWQLTHALFGGTLATSAIDLLYTLWVPLLLIAVALAAVAPRLERARFLLAFGASWLLIGVAGAYLFASAGPCYLALTGVDAATQFDPLMNRLHTASRANPLNAVVWQGMLWNAHVTSKYDFGMGISAMPSMHNAIAVLYALVFWNASAWLRYGSRIFCLVIFVGSVHLGWHYALDGIIAAAAMIAIWAATNAYLRSCGYVAAVEGARAGAIADSEEDYRGGIASAPGLSTADASIPGFIKARHRRQHHGATYARR